MRGPVSSYNRARMHAFRPLALLAASLAATLTSCSSLEDRARAIHTRTLTLDTHKDISPMLATETSDPDPEQQRRYRERFDPTVRGRSQVDFPKMREGELDCAFFIVYVDQKANTPGAFRQAKREADLKFAAIERMCAKFPEHIELARTPADVRRIIAAGKLVAAIGIENGYPMGDNPAHVEEFWHRGARYMSITHNDHNQLGDSHTPAEPLHGGLTDLGRQAVAEMNRVGIMVDISHAAKSTMMQVLEVTKAPVIASHSGSRAVCDHTRNLDDEQLRALAENGGVVQCVALGAFVKDESARRAALDALRAELELPSRGAIWRRQQETEPLPDDLQAKLDEFERRKVEVDAQHPEANVSHFVDHIDHIVRTIGIDHVGIASDFDGGGGIDGWRDASETPNVTAELVRRGYSAEDIEKIWSGNLLRVWQAVQDASTPPH